MVGRGPSNNDPAQGFHTLQSDPEQQSSHRPQTPPPVLPPATLSTRHFLVAIYAGTLRASMMS